MNAFVKYVIATNEDGHDFFPYQEFETAHGGVPTKEDIAEFVLENGEIKLEDMISNERTGATKATLTQILKRWKQDSSYRSAAINAAVDYIYDPDFSYE